METIFKVGDKVFDYTYGWGIVDDINHITVRVKFDSISGNQVLFWGILLKTLSFTEYTLEGFSQERPEILPERGQIVWVRDYENEEWIIRYFVFKKENGFYVTSTGPYKERQNGSYYKYLTTENPYENAIPKS